MMMKMLLYLNVCLFVVYLLKKDPLLTQKPGQNNRSSFLKGLSCTF